MHVDLMDKSNILNRQYESTFSREDETNIVQLEEQPYSAMSNIEIDRDGWSSEFLKKNNF